MSYRYDEFAAGEVYHVCSRGVNHGKIFRDQTDFQRLHALLTHCLPNGQIQSFSIAKRLKHVTGRTPPGQGVVDLLSYCFMSNHIHLLVKENFEEGISVYMQRMLDSYAKYFNVRHERSGPLFTSRFQAVLVDKDEQLLHVSRYIHLNPYVAHMVSDALSYRWSSIGEYTGSSNKRVCHTNLLRSMLDKNEYRAFVLDEADYALTLADYKHLLIDNED